MELTRTVSLDAVRDLLSPDQWRILRDAVAIFGAGFLLKWILKQAWQLSGGFCAFFLAPWGISRINLKKYGPWAVVTGASEGIGRGYALELARQGLNVVIMSRSQGKLQKVADEISELIFSSLRAPTYMFPPPQRRSTVVKFASFQLTSLMVSRSTHR